MIFAEFYGGTGPTVGDRTVIILDARNKPSTWHRQAAQHARRYGYEAWMLRRGLRFTQSRLIEIKTLAEMPAEEQPV